LFECAELCASNTCVPAKVSFSSTPSPRATPLRKSPSSTSRSCASRTRITSPFSSLPTNVISSTRGRSSAKVRPSSPFSPFFLFFALLPPLHLALFETSSRGLMGSHCRPLSEEIGTQGMMSQGDAGASGCAIRSKAWEASVRRLTQSCGSAFLAVCRGTRARQPVPFRVHRDVSKAEGQRRGGVLHARPRDQEVQQGPCFDAFSFAVISRLNL
jgi:hypothetical protein